MKEYIKESIKGEDKFGFEKKQNNIAITRKGYNENVARAFSVPFAQFSFSCSSYLVKSQELANIKFLSQASVLQRIKKILTAKELIDAKSSESLFRKSAGVNVSLSGETRCFWVWLFL